MSNLYWETRCYIEVNVSVNKHQRIPKRQSKIDNPENLVIYGTQDEETENKNTAQYVLDTTLRKQTQLM